MFLRFSPFSAKGPALVWVSSLFRELFGGLWSRVFNQKTQVNVPYVLDVALADGDLSNSSRGSQLERDQHPNKQRC